jgi:3-dehydro-L-gulonate 2-dehydrogenase
MKVPYLTLFSVFKSHLSSLGFSEVKADLCARIFADNSRDGVYSHGLNRFPVFVQLVKDGLVKPDAVPEIVSMQGALEVWNGHWGPGMYNASICMDRAVEIAKEQGIGCVTIKNNNHWMRGGTYGWQAAGAGCIGICFTNAIAGMPPWGGDQPRLGNNPLVIAVPRAEGPVVLDMAMSQYSYGKMQEYELRHEQLPYPGGYDEQGQLSHDPTVIRRTKRALPVGYWKGSGLALMLDIVLTAISGGRSTADLTADAKEAGVSQCFIAINNPGIHAGLIEQILAFTKQGQSGEVAYPGEHTLRTRLRNEAEGIPVNEEIWQQLV